MRIINDPYALAAVMAQAGEHPEVVLEATYGWYWAADLLAGLGASVHLAHPLGVKGFAYRRVKNDFLDAADLADLLRMGRLPEAWIAPPAVRELRELVRHRAKLVHACAPVCAARSTRCWPVRGSRCRSAICSGVKGRSCSRSWSCRRPVGTGSTRLLRLIEAFDREIDSDRQADPDRLRHDPGYRGGADHPRGRADPGGGVRRRDR